MLLKRQRRLLRGGAKKRVALQSVTKPKKSAASSFGTKGGITRALQNVVNRYDVSEEDFERVTNAINAKLKKNDEKLMEREKEIERRLTASQKKFEEAAKGKVAKRKPIIKKNCGKRKTVKVRAHTRCGRPKK